MKIILDADTANEVDDLFSITRLLQAENVELLGLCSTHFRLHEHAPPDSVSASQQLNEELLRLCGREEVPCPCGGNQWMGHAWGGTEPADSPAVQHIITTARSLPSNERLILAGQGAMTNLASALALAPDIIPRVDVHVMGFQYDVSQGIWNKNEFNIRNDLNAADYLLSLDGLDLRVMPAQTCYPLEFETAAAQERLQKAGSLGQFIADHWRSQHDAANRLRVIWDLALISAVLHPEWTESQTVPAPPENGSRPVQVYTKINAEKMAEDFWQALETAETSN